MRTIHQAEARARMDRRLRPRWLRVSATKWRRPVATGGAARRPKAAAQPVERTHGRFCFPISCPDGAEASWMDVVLRSERAPPLPLRGRRCACSSPRVARLRRSTAGRSTRGYRPSPLRGADSPLLRRASDAFDSVPRDAIAVARRPAATMRMPCRLRRGTLTSSPAAPKESHDVSVHSPAACDVDAAADPPSHRFCSRRRQRVGQVPAPSPRRPIRRRWGSVSSERWRNLPPARRSTATP